MKYNIEGGNLPVVRIILDKKEVLIAEAGGRTWSKGEVKTELSSEGGVGKALGRVFSGESLFLSKYTAQENDVELAFASGLPGDIVKVDLKEGESIIAQKGAFLVGTYGITLSLFFRKKIGTGLFGGEGFIMQKITGPGTVFFEIDGHPVEYDLAEDEKIVCDTGVLALMSETCEMDIQRVKGGMNVLFGGEGLFDTVVKGPGKVVLQSMNKATLSAALGVNINSN